MGRLSNGPVTKHIQASNGADCNSKYFYATQYSTSHGRESFLPRVGKHTGTGYKSNFRPGLYYSRRLDEVDNPVLGEMLSTNYVSSHENQFKPNKGPSGKEELPQYAFTKKSGFVRDIPKTLPTAMEVKEAVHNPLTIQPTKCRSLLYQTTHKDPIDNENDFNGPSYFSTENRMRYLGKPSERMDTSNKTVGYKEGSGFIHAFNIEPITYRPNENFHGRFRSIYTNRPTTNSIMKSSFQTTEQPCNNMNTKLLSKRAERDTGYTREIKSVPAYAVHPLQAFTKLEDVQHSRQKYYKKNDPAEYFNMEHPKPYQTITESVFKGVQTNFPKSEGRLLLGRKEDTGYTENNCKFIETAETAPLLDRFNTHYKLRFYDKNPAVLCKDLNKATTMQQAQNGFTKSTCVQSFGKPRDRSEELHEMHPYVARSTRSRDPYFSTTDLKKISI